MLQSDSFYDCSSGSTSPGGCAYLADVLNGSCALDCCATGCEAESGSFCVFTSQNVDAVVKGVAAFDCTAMYGALNHIYVRVQLSGCNFTKAGRTEQASATAIRQ